MLVILTKDNSRYTAESIKHQEKGIVFEYKSEMVFLAHENIKSIEGSAKSGTAKTYFKKN